MTAARFLPALSRAVLPEERYHVPSQIGPTRAEQTMLAEICDGTFRPPDAKDNARIEEAYALYVPFWRVDIQRADTGMHLGRVRIGGIPLPTQESSEAKAVWMVCARTAFPYEMKHPSTILAGDAKPLVVGLASLESGEPNTRGGWEVLDADVTEAQAKDLAAASLKRHSASSGSLFSETNITVRAIHFVRYPIWFARYRYRGDAAPTAEGLFYLGISGVDGTPITAEHPSKLRAAGARVKRLFGLDE